MGIRTRYTEQTCRPRPILRSPFCTLLLHLFGCPQKSVLGRAGIAHNRHFVTPFFLGFHPVGAIIRRVGAGDGDGVHHLDLNVEVDAVAAVVYDGHHAAVPDGVGHYFGEGAFDLFPHLLSHDRLGGKQGVHHQGVTTGFGDGLDVIDEHTVDDFLGVDHRLFGFVAVPNRFSAPASWPKSPAARR